MRAVITPCKRKHCLELARAPQVYCSKECAPLGYLKGDTSGFWDKSDPIYGLIDGVKRVYKPRIKKETKE